MRFNDVGTTPGEHDPRLDGVHSREELATFGFNSTYGLHVPGNNGARRSRVGAVNLNSDTRVMSIPTDVGDSYDDLITMDQQLDDFAF